MDGVSSREISIRIGDNTEANRPGETTLSPKKQIQEFLQLIKDRLDGFFPWVTKYVQKFSGLHENRPNRLTWDEHFWSFTGSLISIVLIAIIHYRLFQK